MAEYSGWQRIVGGTQYLFLCPISVRFVICFSLFRLLLKYLCGIGGIFWLTKHGRGNSIARFVSVTHWLNFSFLYSCPFPVLNSNNNTCKSNFSIFWCHIIIHSCALSIHSLSSFDEIAWTLSIPLETSTLSGLLPPRDWLCKLVMWLLEVYSISILYSLCTFWNKELILFWALMPVYTTV